MHNNEFILSESAGKVMIPDAQVRSTAQMDWMSSDSSKRKAHRNLEFRFFEILHQDLLIRINVNQTHRK